MSCRLLKNLTLFLIVALVVQAWAVSAAEVAPPPNGPATIRWNAEQGKLGIQYRGGAILDAKVVAEDASGQVVPDTAIKLEPVETRGEKEKIEQIFLKKAVNNWYSN